MKKAILHTDGGARGNPGPAGIGIVLAIEGQKKIGFGKYVGDTTNNQAEYEALLEGMKMAIGKGVTDLDCFLDSELVVKQLAGIYRVKNVGLRIIYDKICELKNDFDRITFRHVRREKNQEADKMVNLAIDKKGEIVI